MAAFVPVALGVGDGLIPDDAMRASSVLDRYHVPSQGRLNNTKQGKSGGAWKPKLNDKKQYLEVDLGALTNVSQVGVFCLGAVLTCLNRFRMICFDKNFGNYNHTHRTTVWVCVLLVFKRAKAATLIVIYCQNYRHPVR